MVLPLAVEDGVSKTEVSVVNLGDESQTVSLELRGGEGESLALVDVELAPKGLTRQTLVGFFPDEDLSLVSHLGVAASGPVVVGGLVVDFELAGSQFRRESVVIRAQAPGDGTRQIIPQYSSGGGFASVLGVVSAAGTAQEIVLTAYTDDGTLWEVAQNPVRLTLAGNGGIREPVATLFGAVAPDEGELESGWIEIDAPVGFISSYVGLGNLTTPAFAVVEGIDADEASVSQVVGQIRSGNGFFTGVAVVNPGESVAEVEFTAMLADGTRIGKAVVELEPGERLSRLLQDLIPAVFEQASGWLLMRSGAPVVVGSLVGTTTGLALIGMPAVEAGSGFTPPAQVTAAISGVVIQTGVGVADVSVALSGPVSRTIRTDASGRYVFTQLPVGEYRLDASRVGAEFFPAERVVDLETENVGDQNFQAGGITEAEVPVLTLISPSSAFSGNQLLSLAVQGANFNPATFVRFNDTDLATTFVSSAELAAVMPASLLEGTGDASISVVTPPPGGGDLHRGPVCGESAARGPADRRPGDGGFVSLRSGGAPGAAGGRGDQRGR